MYEVCTDYAHEHEPYDEDGGRMFPVRVPSLCTRQQNKRKGGEEVNQINEIFLGGRNWQKF